MRFNAAGRGWAALVVLVVCPLARATEHVTLRNGFELDCVRREASGDKVRLYFAANGGGGAADANFLEVAADTVVRVEQVADVPRGLAPAAVKASAATSLPAEPTQAEMQEMLSQAGTAHNIDADLLASPRRPGGSRHLRPRP